MAERDDDSQSTWGPVVAFSLLGIALVAAAGKWPSLLTIEGLSNQPFHSGDAGTVRLHPVMELLKLVVAALVGIVVTLVHRRYHRDKPLPRSLLQAQVLLCVAGAIIMIIIGNSVARAFGVAGAAGIVRFRTPVEDPKDTTLLFLLVGLGMACGVGLLEIAGLATLFICGVLVLLDRFGDVKLRTMILSVTATSKDFPTESVNRILDSLVEQYEMREMLNSGEPTVRYTVNMQASTPIAWITQRLIEDQAAEVKSVSWMEPPKK